MTFITYNKLFSLSSPPPQYNLLILSPTVSRTRRISWEQKVLSILMEIYIITQRRIKFLTPKDIWISNLKKQPMAPLGCF